MDLTTHENAYANRQRIFRKLDTPTAPGVTNMDAAITSQDINGPVTNEALDQLLRGPAVTIEDLQVRVVSLEERCEELENYTRCNKMRIRGLTETTNKDTDRLVKDLAARKLDVAIENSDVVISHCMGKRAEDRSTPREIIVRFTMHKVKTSVMRNARKLKGTSLLINEDMTKLSATIAWETRTLKRE